MSDPEAEEQHRCRILGVNIAAGRAYVTHVHRDDGLVDDSGLRRFELSTAMSDADALTDFFARFGQTVRGVRPCAVVLLHTKNYGGWSYSDAFRRSSIESAIAIATRSEGIGYRLIKQEDVGKHLGIGGRFNSSQFSSACAGLDHGGGSPKYWKDRAPAFAAASLALGISGVCPHDE